MNRNINKSITGLPADRTADGFMLGDSPLDDTFGDAPPDAGNGKPGECGFVYRHIHNSTYAINRPASHAQCETLSRQQPNAAPWHFHSIL